MHTLVLIWESLREAFLMFWDTLWTLVLGFGLSGAVQAFVSREEMRRAMGDEGPGSLARATFFGMVSSSCSYAASAMAKSLFQKGASFTAAMVFMFASTNLVIELGLVLWVLLGWQFAASEFVGGLIMIVLLALASRFVLTPAVVRAARKRLGEDAEVEVDGTTRDEPWRERITSAAGWSDAASYTMADVKMLRREMAVGYIVAGFLAVLVPAPVWNAVFLSGHGFLTSLENALVGPLIAIISFVCSIGNVPLAAALWQGGITFGGVVSFIFADLITLPLILIYRRFYGGRLTLRLVILFWGVMSAAGLATEYLFLGLGIIPERNPVRIAVSSIGWDHTTFLNIAAIIAFAGLFWLSRNRERFGGGKGYAIDPVCGMQVQIGNAPARAVHGGKTYYFCSDRCRERFDEAPERYAGAREGDVREPHAMHGDHAGEETDPVCGMKVDPENAAATHTYGGRAYYFCSEGCARAFEKDPEHYLKEAG